VPTDRYPGPARKALFDDLTARLARMPGVTAVTTSNGVPTAGGAIHFADALVVEGAAAPATKKLVILPNTSAAPDFFATMEIPVIEGRTFTADDRPATAVISRSMAQRYWPGKSAVGGRFRLSERAEWLTVVGVAGEVRALGVDDTRGEIEMYSPLWPRRPAPVPSTTPSAAVNKPVRNFASAMLLVRADNPISLVPSIKAAVWAIDKNQPIEKIVLVEDLLAASLKEQRFALVLMTSFAVLALVLAAAGLYAVLSNLVAQRRQEIGIRVALGARTSDVMHLVVTRGLGLTLVGLTIGLAGSLALARYIRSQLFEVSERDPFSFFTVAMVLAAVALLASWVPTRRALSIDPATALRTD
jgi:putative ABC transport system permease protein